MSGFGLMNIGSSALLASQALINTTGNNIANVNTPGYSRQTTDLNNRQEQFSGGGYVGKGVDVKTVSRNYDQYLSTNANTAQTLSSADGIRSDLLTQLEQVFPIGANGLGTSISNVFSAFSNMANTPTDMTARTGALSNLTDFTSRVTNASTQLDNLQTQVNGQMTGDVTQVNQLASQIATLNHQIQQASAIGQPPNDLLDQRDTLINSLNKYVQTSSIPAGDGTIGIFVAGGQPLVLSSTAAKLQVTIDPTDSTQQSLQIVQPGISITLTSGSIGGGELGGLLRFQNQDLSSARQTLGNIALSAANTLNNEHQLGLDLNGNIAGPIFNIPTITAQPNPANLSAATVKATVSDPTNNQLQPSNYLIQFTSATTGTITRLTDVPPNPVAITPPAFSFDGLNFAVSVPPVAGDSFTVKPAGTIASKLALAVNAPQQLSATPLSFALGTQNNNSATSLRVAALVAPQHGASAQAQANPYLTNPVTITFTSPTTFDVQGDGTENPTGLTYTPGAPISYNGWKLTLTGTPSAKDVVKLQSFTATGDIGTSLLNGGSLNDAYASALSNVGTMVQSGKAAAALSASIATDAKTAALNVSGVNLDEEAAKLIQYQQSYQASAKILTVAQTIFDTLLQTVSR